MKKTHMSKVKKKSHSITIRLGAAHWDAQVAAGDGSSFTIDIRKANRKQRGIFFGALRDTAEVKFGNRV